MYTKQLLEDVNKIINPNFLTTEDIKEIQYCQKLLIETFESKYVFNDQLNEGVIQKLKDAAKKVALLTVATAIGAGAATMYLKGDMSKDAAAAIERTYADKVSTADNATNDPYALYNANVLKIMDYVVQASNAYEINFFGNSMNKDQLDGKLLMKQLALGKKLNLDEAQKTKIASFLQFMFSSKVSDKDKGSAATDFKSLDKDSLSTQNPGYNLDEAKKLVNDKMSMNILVGLMKKIQNDQTKLVKSWNNYLNTAVKKAKTNKEVENIFLDAIKKLKNLRGGGKL